MRAASDLLIKLLADDAPWMIKLEPDSENGLSRISAADSFQIRSISQERFVKHIGIVTETIMEEIRIGIAKVLTINTE